VTRRLPNTLCLAGKNPSQECECKWSLLKVREGKYKREHGGHRWYLEAERESPSLLQMLLKPTLIYGRGGAK
jgi:hypothetical protein